MAYSVLILDDDADFNSLLTDIFEQADYIVASLQDPVEALEVFESTDFDLVVTDQKMPEMSGSDFMKAVKAIKPRVPVIMVSGYLENDTIRELIGEGVGGVFLKPLNIFSLLERTSELIEEAKKLQQAPEASSADAVEAEPEDSPGVSGFKFRSFPCKSQASTSFAERLYSLRNFKSTLSLIGEKGTHYRAICEDIRGFYKSEREHFIYLNPGSFDSGHVLTSIETAERKGAERVTCVLMEVESMDAAQKELAASLAKGEGVFASTGIAVRTLFTVSGDLDALFDEGLVNENLYILMGTAEVRVPPLRECANDIPVMAQQLVAEITSEKGRSTMPHFEKSARDFLRKHPWEGNFAELRETVRGLVEKSSGDTVTLTALGSAIQAAHIASPRTRLEAHLSNARVDTVRAVSVFFGGDRTKVAEFLGTETATIEEILQ